MNWETIAGLDFEATSVNDPPRCSCKCWANAAVVIKNTCKTLNDSCIALPFSRAIKWSSPLSSTRRAMPGMFFINAQWKIFHIQFVSSSRASRLISKINSRRKLIFAPTAAAATAQKRRKFFSRAMINFAHKNNDEAHIAFNERRWRGKLLIAITTVKIFSLSPTRGENRFFCHSSQHFRKFSLQRENYVGCPVCGK